MALKYIEEILSEKFGINPVSAGPETIASAVQMRMKECCAKDTEDYIRLLNRSKEEAEELFEMIVVPETWFFRDREPFVFLKQYIQNIWLAKNSPTILNVLSAPCSTGEEPYSIAITLMEAGLKENDFSIKAVDISRKAIKKARQGIYEKNSFRNTDLGFQKKYFTLSKDTFVIIPEVKKNVTFIKANLKDRDIFNEDSFYDVIFCRNLLIYLDPDGKQHLLNTIDRILKTEGIVFLGYAETFNMLQKKYAVVDYEKSFAFIKKKQSEPEDRSAGKNRNFVKRNEKKSIRVKTAENRRKIQDKKVLSENVFTPSSSHFETLFQKAIKLADDGFVEEALSLCQICIDEEGPGAGVFTLMGLIEDIRGNTEKAEDYLGKALYLDPDNLEAITQLVLIMEKQNKREKAALFRQRAERIRSIYV